MNRSKPMRRTELPKMSASRLAEWEALGIRPTSTFKPKPKAKMAAPKRPRDTGPDDATVAAVMKRDRGRCVGCGDPVGTRRGIDYSIHHRKLRSQGVDNRLSNLILLDGSGTTGCHGLAHSEVAASRLSGFLVRSTEDPEQVAAEHSQHGLVFLLDDGSVVQVSEGTPQ